MTVTIETDLKEILGLINQKLDNLQKDVTDLSVGQVELKGDVKSLDEKLSGQIKSLDEKFSGQIKSLDEKLSGQIKSLDEKLSGQIKTVDEKVKGVDERVKNQEFVNRNRGIFGGLILIILGGFAKIFGFLPNP